MRYDGNHLFFDGNVGGDPLSALSALHNIVHKLGYQDIVLDFSKAERLWPAYMIPLATICRSYRSEKVDFEIILPDDRKLAGFMINTNWAHIISPERFDSAGNKNPKHMAARQFMTSEEHFKAVDDSISLILGNVPGIDRKRIKALEWALNEITDNVLNHAQSPIGGVMQVFTFPNKRRVEFFVCDAGITVPRSLRSGRPDIKDDISAIRAAIEEGVTRNKQTNQGNGLYGTFKCCEVSGGEFGVVSGLTSLQYRPGQLHATRNAIPFVGTFVRAAIGYDFDRLLEKALVFGGKQHEPGFDYIERHYENDKDWIDFKVETEISAFGSREAGRLALTKILNLMDNRSTPIDFDFSNIPLITSSFADEVFGRLFIQLGPIRFTQLCHFKNVDPTVRALIDRAIAQRMRVPTDS
jgi:anti-sigma regulatory factor (Ser/Thr protein kinase)